MAPDEVIKKFFPKSQKVTVEKYGGGSINSTFRVLFQECDKKNYYILQKMSSIFEPIMMEDIEAVTMCLQSKGMITPLVIKTPEGSLCVEDNADGSWWRMFSYIPGESFEAVKSLGQAKSAGEIIGLFHSALSDLKYEFKFRLPHFHDTDFIMQKLLETAEENKGSEKYKLLCDLVNDILESYKKIKLGISANLKNRIIHGDLKISNVRFDQSGENAIALIDLDTLMLAPIYVELGDALRSWCMPGGEDVDVVSFDKEVYSQALNGYFTTAKFLTEEEKESIPYGVKLITLELSARFVMDAFNESYFRLDSSKYKTLFEQNKKRAENQYAFFKVFSVEN